MTDVIMVYPKVGTYEAIFKDLPLSLIYSATIAYHNGYDIKIIDQRIDRDWKNTLKKELDKQPFFVAISTMTGKQINYALEVSKFVRENSDIPLVWGGIHPTILPHQTLENKYVDIVIRGEGEETLHELIIAFKNKKNFKDIKGISYKKDGKIYHNPNRNPVDVDKLPSLPYNLVKVSNYIRTGWDEKIFSIQTSRGCPHRCGFCFSPSFSKSYWRGESVKKTMDHLKLIMDDYNPDYIYFIDNDFFVNLNRAEELFKKIKKEKIDVIFGHRGTRIDELYKMDNNFLKLMEDIRTREIHIGAESGSQRMLDLITKDISVEQTISVNKKLNNYPGLIPFYNFIGGIPTETEEDIKKTTDLILKLLKENPNAQADSINQFTPYPGTALFELAKKYGFKEPDSLEKWADFDQMDCSKNTPWVDKERKKLLDMLYFTGFFVDKKMNTHLNSKKIGFTLFRMLSNSYRPVARFRFKNHLTVFPVEVKLKNIYFDWVDKNL